ncbi:MAG: glycosyltransferase family 4 protein [Candidatus Saganbacteria bacterium]|nr:glycosyltransferase family 4 protein [Candidatus Saganbacteria bacterium]
MEKHVHEIAKILAKTNELIIVTENNEENSLSEKEKVDGFTILRMKRSSKRYPNIMDKYWFFATHFKLLLAADIIHFHDFGSLYYWYLPFRFILFWKEYYMTFHGWEGQCPPRKKIILIRKLCQYLTRGNICAGEFIVKWYGTRANIVTYGGIDESILFRQESAPKKEGAVFIGRLNFDTGIKEIIEALVILRDEFGKRLPLIICADGPLMPQIKKRVEETGLEVEFKGFVKDPFLIARQFKYAFVTGYLGILEAMAQKSLVFAIYDNAMKKDYLELIPHSQEMLEIAGNSSSLAEKVNFHLTHPSADKMIETAYSFVKNRSIKNLVLEYQNLWSKADGVGQNQP